MSKFWCCQIFVFTSLVNVGFMASARLDRNIRLGFLVHLSARVGQSGVLFRGMFYLPLPLDLERLNKSV